MEYRLNKQKLLDIMELWNRFLKRRVHLIACGGTAMTLLDVKASTKDVDRQVNHYRELVSYDIAVDRIGVHIDRFVELLLEENLYE
jgi:peroxiredoxin family protein